MPIDRIVRACGGRACRTPLSTGRDGEPAHAMLNIRGLARGALRPPCDPPGFRAGVGAAEHGGRLRNLVAVRGDGRPAAISHRGEPVAHDPCALRRGLSGGRGGGSPFWYRSRSSRQPSTRTSRPRTGLPRFACPPSFGRRETRRPNEGPIRPLLSARERQTTQTPSTPRTDRS